ncbi:MAG: nucleotidyl transferase AbiEii/AbiGii toxin family protein [Verrucomicrobiales bacterium]
MKKSNSQSVDLIQIREDIIAAMFSDEQLVNQFVLKGGNALNLVHQLPGRTSLDIDLSIPGDFAADELQDVEDRIFNGLRAQFTSRGLSVIDGKFVPKPKQAHLGQDPTWGGYTVEFKLVKSELLGQIADDEHAVRMAAIEVEPSGSRKFMVDISKYEYCDPKIPYELNGSVIYVYSLPMVAIEKLRALCQQLPQYEPRGYSTPRARDFYDIYRIVKERGVDLCRANNLALFRPIFAAKQVPLSFLSAIVGERETHRPDWPSVMNASTESDLQDYDFYFDFVISLIQKLQALGIK